MSVRRGFALSVMIVTTSLTAPGASRAGIEATASAGATVQPAGPRGGDPGKSYLNVEGKNNGENGQYSCFAVLDFKPAKPDVPVAKVKGLTLTLTQSVPRFAKDGPVKLWVATDTDTVLEGDSSPLKFDPKVSGGVGDQLKPLLPLGAATFTKRKTGETDTIALTPPADTEGYLRGQLNRGGVVRLVLTPADDDVAATYFGAGADQAERRPRLVVDATP
jgi:hypothetical protein